MQNDIDQWPQVRGGKLGAARSRATRERMDYFGVAASARSGVAFTDMDEQLLLPLHLPRQGNLLISRKPGEWVQIGDIRVRVVRGGREPLLSISAPRDVPIVRGEAAIGLAEAYRRELTRRQQRQHRSSQGPLTQTRDAA